jgi:hypothetical protein
MLCGCNRPPPPLPAGWPLPALGLPDNSRALPLGSLLPPDRPYYSSGSDEAIRAALETHARLLGQGEPADPAQSTFSDRPVLSRTGDSGRGWGIAFEIAGGGFDYALAECETALLRQGYEIVEYVPGQLRVYYSPDRRREVVLVAGHRWQLLLAVAEYDPPLPGELEEAMREDGRHAGAELGEFLKTYMLERKPQAPL